MGNGRPLAHARREAQAPATTQRQGREGSSVVRQGSSVVPQGSSVVPQGSSVVRQGSSVMRQGSSEFVIWSIVIRSLVTVGHQRSTPIGNHRHSDKAITGTHLQPARELWKERMCPLSMALMKLSLA